MMSPTIRALFTLFVTTTIVLGSWNQGDARVFTKDRYEDMIAEIATHGFDANNGLPQGFILPSPEYQPNGKIRVVYNFGVGDHAFGSFLSDQTVGDEKYNLHLIKDKDQWPVDDQGQIKMPKSTPDFRLGLSFEYNWGEIPWITNEDEKKAYMMQRKGDEWSLTDSNGEYIKPYDHHPLNPWRRSAMTVGMWYDLEQQNYANNYVVTFDVDPRYVFRPKPGQLVSQLEAESNPMKEENGHYVMNEADWPLPWNPEAAIPRMFAVGSPHILSSRSDMLHNQWTAQVLGGNFPWTGIGYTYDWYYQDRSKWSEHEGVGLSEMVVMPSSDYDVYLEIVKVETTAQFLGASEQFPGVPEIPEPGSLHLLWLGLVGLTQFLRCRSADRSL